LEGWIIQINLENYFLRTLVIVVGMSLAMIAVALGGDVQGDGGSGAMIFSVQAQ
jgi:hypothetical protein